MRQIIYNISILTQNKQREVITRGFLIIKDGLIEKIGSGENYGNVKDKDLIINGAGQIVTPGLINVHVHLGETIYREFLSGAFTLERYLIFTEDLVKKYPLIETERETISEYSALQLMKQGASTIAGGRVSQAAKSLGLRNISGYMIMKSEKLKKFLVNISEQYGREVSRNKRDGLSSQAIFIHSLNFVDQAELISIKKILNKFPKSIFIIHVAETLEQEKKVAVKFGQNSILTLDKLGLLNKNTILIHGNWMTKKEFGLVQKSKASLVHCFSSNTKVADRVLNIEEALNYNINICLATDGVSTSDTFSVLDEAKNVYQHYLMSNRKLVTTQRVFDMITINAARALGLESLIGSIELGKRADLAFWDNSFAKDKEKNLITNFIDWIEPPEMQSLMIDGKMIIWYKELLNNNENKIISKFRTLTKKIKKLENENNIGQPSV